VTVAPAKCASCTAGYHHGDLPGAAAIEIIEHSGIGGFSLSKAAKRAAVSSGAPYQHYRDGQALLADIAVHGSRDLATVMRRVTARDPAELLGKRAAARPATPARTTPSTQ
jgi:AcrR family transcriptional regulator